MTNERIKTIKINKKKILSRLRKKTKSMMISSLSSEDPWCNDFLADCCNCCPDEPTECPTDCSGCPETYLVKIESGSFEGDHIVQNNESNTCLWVKSFGGSTFIFLFCDEQGGGWRVRASGGIFTTTSDTFVGFNNCPPTGSYGNLPTVTGIIGGPVSVHNT